MNDIHRSTTKILVVEDNAILALDMELCFRAAGHEIMGPVANVADALILLTESRPDFATLDFNLQDETSIPIAKVLHAMGTPFVFVTGRPEDLSEHPEVPCAPALAKPVNPHQVLQTVLSCNQAPDQRERCHHLVAGALDVRRTRRVPA